MRPHVGGLALPRVRTPKFGPGKVPHASLLHSRGRGLGSTGAPGSPPPPPTAPRMTVTVPSSPTASCWQNRAGTQAAGRIPGRQPYRPPARPHCHHRTLRHSCPWTLSPVARGFLSAPGTAACSVLCPPDAGPCASSRPLRAVCGPPPRSANSPPFASTPPPRA